MLFAVDVKYDLPRSRTALRAEEVKKKKSAKVPRRASSRVVSRGGIIETTPVVGQSGLSGRGWRGRMAGRRERAHLLARSLAEVDSDDSDDGDGYSVLGSFPNELRSWQASLSS